MTALITGGSSGMGLEFARQLAGRGFDILLVSNRPEELEKAAASLQSDFPVRVSAHFQDLALPDAADNLFTWCTEEEGILPDILVNSAGMFFFKELEVEDLGRVQAMVNLHVVTVTRLCLLFGSAMKRRGSGRILNMASMAAVALVVFVSLFYVDAGYGKFYQPKWGPSVDNHLGWFLMEVPVFVAMLVLWWMSDRREDGIRLVFLLLFELHYFHRSFIFPLQLRGHSRMPPACSPWR